MLRIKLQLLLVWFELSLGSKNDENNEVDFCNCFNISRPSMLVKNLWVCARKC